MMGILRTEGFDALLRAVAEEASGHSAVEDAVRHAASLGGRFASRTGLRALTRAEEVLLDRASAGQTRLSAPDAGSDTVLLTETGRVRLLRRGTPAPAGCHVVGGVRWPSGRPDALDAQLDAAEQVDLVEAQQMHAHLRDGPREQVDAMIRSVREALQHMAPVVLYGGDRCYTNLGRRSNLTGKSLRPDDERCVLRRLETSPVEVWDAWDASFLVCVDALMSSGPPVRAEELSGAQLRPDRLAEFLVRRTAGYGEAGGGAPGALAPSVDGPPTGESLGVLATRCREARARCLARGARPYRLIEGLTLNKQEHLESRPVDVADLPAVVRTAASELLGTVLPDTFERVASVVADAGAGGRPTGQEAPGFSSRLEAVLHGIVHAATEASESHVGMTRGPRRPRDLARELADASTAPLLWTTKDFFCCVAPSDSFVERFTDVPDQLPQVLRAISARMRYNGWHYLPHSVGMTGSGVRDDWFYAPTMADITDWSSQHHTGHVANGVRYAIRVPFGIELAGAHRPGLHDFRLMRVDGRPYTMADLRGAMATAELLRCVYQAHADRVAGAPSDAALDDGGVDVLDFGNTWYSERYAGAPTDADSATKHLTATYTHEM